jgi:hypothetical protein
MGFTGTASLVATDGAKILLLFLLLGQNKENRDRESVVLDTHCHRLAKQPPLYCPSTVGVPVTIHANKE